MIGAFALCHCRTCAIDTAYALRSRGCHVERKGAVVLWWPS